MLRRRPRDTDETASTSLEENDQRHPSVDAAANGGDLCLLTNHRLLLMPPRYGGIKRYRNPSVRLSVCAMAQLPWRAAALGYRQRWQPAA